MTFTPEPPLKKQKLNTGATHIPTTTQIRNALIGHETKYENIIKSTINSNPSHILLCIEDMKSFGFGVTTKECKICKKIFANIKASKGHMATSRSHQINFIIYILKNKLSFPHHIEMKNLSKQSLKPSKNKNNIINMFNAIKQKKAQKNIYDIAPTNTHNTHEIKSLASTSLPNAHNNKHDELDIELDIDLDIEGKSTECDEYQE
eukprot:92882_1